MSAMSEAGWNAAITAALQANDIEAVPKLLVLMALDGYGHEAESLRRAVVALTPTTTADPERAALAEGSDA